MQLLFYIFLLIPYFEPPAIEQCNTGLHMLYRLYLYGSILLTLILYFVELVYYKSLPGKMVFYAILFSAALVFSTILNHGETKIAILDGLVLISLFSLCEMMLKKSLMTFLDAMSPLMSTLVVLNFITLIAFPNGMYINTVLRSSFWSSPNNWLLGYDNAFFAYLLPAMLFSIIRNIYLKRTPISAVRTIIICSICFYSVLSRWQAGSVVSILLFGVLSLLIILNIEPKFFNSVSYLLGNVILFFGIVVFRLQNVFADLIIHGLGKDLSFTGRTRVWDASFKSIGRSLWTGYGLEDVYKTIGKLKLSSTHNSFLWILYRGGILQFLPFTAMIMDSTIQLFKNRNKPYVAIAAAGMCCMFLNWQIEAITANSLMMLFIFSYYIGIVPTGTEVKFCDTIK